MFGAFDLCKLGCIGDEFEECIMVVTVKQDHLLVRFSMRRMVAIDLMMRNPPRAHFSENFILCDWILLTKNSLLLVISASYLE